MNNSNTPPDKPGNSSSGGSSKNISYSGATELSSSATLTGEIYSSSTGGENALLVQGGEITLENPTVSKTGDESSEDSDFYGTNAAILATSGTLKISGGSVETNASHANAVFAYSSGEITLDSTEIKTSGNNSGGVMVTGGGSLSASNVSVETSGNSSAAIRSDRGGGTLTVEGGSFKTSGVGSPAIYSTANISVSEASLTSTSSEGVVIEGSNSVSLDSVTLTDTNVSLNGNSETYKNIFIYQSMSGDAEEGIGVFSAKNSVILTNKGDTFFITNTTAKISLSGNSFINTDESSAFLRAQAGKWGTSGKNGGVVALSLDSQVVEGDLVLDSISGISVLLENESFYQGTINGENSAAAVSVELSEDSIIVLTGDSYFTSLDNASESNENIYANGHTLYVAGSEVSINESEAPALPEVVISSSSESTEETEVTSNICLDPETGELCGTSSSPSLTLIISLAVCAVLVIGLIIFAILKLRKKTPQDPILPPQENPNATPYNPFSDPINPQPQTPPQTPQSPQVPETPDSPASTPDNPPENPPAAPEN